MVNKKFKKNKGGKVVNDNKKNLKKSKMKKSKKLDEAGLLVENFTLMQRTLTDVIITFKNLEKKFDKFLGLVEKAVKKEISEATKGTTEKKKGEEKGEIKKEGNISGDLSKKLDELLEQNKVIAEGILLLEKFIKGKLEKE